MTGGLASRLFQLPSQHDLLSAQARPRQTAVHANGLVYVTSLCELMSPFFYVLYSVHVLWFVRKR
jgi:hypothetical protein